MTFSLPDTARVGTVVPKKAFYTHSKVNAKTKRAFTDQIQKITWLYKLAPHTVNLSATEQIEEIQIFQLDLKEQDIPRVVLRAIDRAIPYPILFVITYQSRTAYAISLKVAGEDRWYITSWNELPELSFRGTTLEAVYQGIVRALLGESQQSPEQDFETVVSTDARRRQLEREIKILKNKIKREPQFAKQVELNKELQQKQKELAMLGH